jgi:hypothetical protein
MPPYAGLNPVGLRTDWKNPVGRKKSKQRKTRRAKRKKEEGRKGKTREKRSTGLMRLLVCAKRKSARRRRLRVYIYPNIKTKRVAFLVFLVTAAVPCEYLGEWARVIKYPCVIAS